MSAPLISILMPVKNAGKFLDLTIESILQQTYQNWELIAVNDHSDDNSPEVLMRFAEKDTRVKVFPNQGSGIIQALRTAFGHASGSYITRMDADDLMSNEKLEALITPHVSSDEEIVTTGLVKAFAEPDNCGRGFVRYALKINHFILSENPWRYIYNDCLIPSPCWMLGRKTLLKMGAFESESYPEDYDLCFSMYKQQLKVVCIPRVLHLWRDHPYRVSRTHEIYAEPEFFPLKFKHFMELDYDSSIPLVFYGAGPKAKKAVKIFQESYPGISFYWTTANERKWNQNIYGINISEKPILEKLQHGVVIWLVSSIDSSMEMNAEKYPQLIWLPFC